MRKLNYIFVVSLLHILVGYERVIYLFFTLYMWTTEYRLSLLKCYFIALIGSLVSEATKIYVY